MTPVELLKDLLRIDTTNPPGNEDAAAQVLQSSLDDAGLKTTIALSPEGRANLIGRIEGPADVPSLVLLSHLDVVGVEGERWSHDPFGADEADGFVWGRGALDMKGIAAMHAHAAGAVARSGATPTREVIVAAVADEEQGGAQGAQWLLNEHPELVGFGEGRPPPEVLGEGAFGMRGILDRPVMPIVVGEKQALRIRIEATGTPGHGSLPPSDMAIRKLASFLDRIPNHGRPRIHPVIGEQFAALAAAAKLPKRAVFRALSSAGADAAVKVLAPALKSNANLAALISDTASPTRFEAGYRNNVVPGSASAAVDLRLLPDTDPDEVLTRLRARGRGENIAVEEIDRTGGPVSDKTPLYDALSEASLRLDPSSVVIPTLCPGITDVRFFRARGAVGYGWVPLLIDPELAATIHGHDERIPVEGFERAAAATADLVAKIAARS